MLIDFAVRIAIDKDERSHIGIAVVAVAGENILAAGMVAAEIRYTEKAGCKVAEEVGVRTGRPEGVENIRAADPAAAVHRLVATSMVDSPSCMETVTAVCTGAGWPVDLRAAAKAVVKHRQDVGWERDVAAMTSDKVAGQGIAADSVDSWSPGRSCDRTAILPGG